MKKLFSQPSMVLLLGAMLAGFLLIGLVQLNQPLGDSPTPTDAVLRAQSSSLVLFIGVAMVLLAALLGVVMYIWSNSLTTHNPSTTGGFDSVPSVSSIPSQTLTPEDTRSQGTRPASLAARPPLAYLIGPDHQSVVIRSTDFTIGRSEDNHLVLNDPRVSRHHARIVMQHGHFMLCNLSKGGTVVNYRPVMQAAVLQGGEQLMLGPIELRFTLPTQQDSSRVQRV